VFPVLLLLASSAVALAVLRQLLAFSLRLQWRNKSLRAQEVDPSTIFESMGSWISGLFPPI